MMVEAERPEAPREETQTVSHVAEIKAEFRDLAAVRAACKRLGFELREGQQTYKWWGYSVGDYPIPEGFAADQLGKCDHAIRVPGATYEVGIVRRGDRYLLLWDFIDGQLCKAMGGKEGHRFIQAYATEAAKLAARKKGYTVTEETAKDGTIRLNVTVPN